MHMRVSPLMLWHHLLKWVFWTLVVGCLVFVSIGVYVALYGNLS
jgi:hypothetical protein